MLYRFRRYLPFLGILLLAVLSGCQGHVRPYERIKYPKLKQIQVPKIERLTLPNGMRLFLVEDHELPVIGLAAMIRTGSVYEPADKVGLAQITGQVIRTGGTSQMSGDQIDWILEQKGASIETSIELTAGHVSAWSLKEDFDTVLSILAGILREPAFSQEKIDLAKMQQRSAISRRNDDPGDIASREFTKLIYGPNSPYARHPEYQTIDRITRQDLVDFHKRFFGPNHTWMAIWGDFETSRMVSRVTELFGNWPAIDANLPHVPALDYRYVGSVNLIKKHDINQSYIILGHIGGRMDDPDYCALIVMNQILGQGFTSRLFRNVRSRQGLAYSVYGRYECQYDHPGLFMVGCQTQSARTVHAIKAMQQEINTITETEVTDQELAYAKEAFLNAFVFSFSSTGDIVRRLMAYDYYGYPPDFLEKVRQNVEKVIKADILRAAKSHLRPGALQILVVGRPEDFDQDLSVLGPVRSIDITIPGLTKEQED